MKNKMSAKAKLYAVAVEWIALNDDPGSCCALDSSEVRGMISVCLVSDVFDVSRDEVADDVVNFRTLNSMG